MKDLEKIGSEVYAALSNVSIEKYNKIDPKIIEVFEKYRESSQNIKINPEVDFENQNISKEAKDIIFMIAIDYWLTEKEKEEVLQKLKGNDRLKELEFNYDNLFKNETQKADVSNVNTDIVEKEEKWYIKILNKVKALLKSI